MTDDTGNITETYGYDAWEAIAEHTGTNDEKLTYVGKYGVTMEPDDGLLMMGLRFYDPELGIFLQKDPFPGYIEDPAMLHPYMYTRNDPVNKIDPTGESWLSDGLGWLNRKVVQPAARWTNENVIKPTARVVEKHIIQPVKKHVVELAKKAINDYVIEPLKNTFKKSRGTASGKSKNKKKYDKKKTQAKKPGLKEEAIKTAKEIKKIPGTIAKEFSAIPGTVSGGIKGGFKAFDEAVVKERGGASAIGIFNEPLDWAVTFSDWKRGDFRATDLAGLLPFVSHGMVRGGIKIVDEGADLVKDALKASDAAKGTGKINKAKNLIKEYLGNGIKAERNEAGDLILQSEDELKKVRFDINRPNPHKNPHFHVEEFKKVKNKKVQTLKSGPQYPIDVPNE